MSEEKGMSLTPKQLQELITAAVTAAVSESRKPLPQTEAQLAEIQQAQDLRIQQRDLILQEQANKRANQLACSHLRSARQGGGTTAVYVPVISALICQQCQALIKPEPDPKDGDARYIYNTQLFNYHFSQSQETNIFG